MIFFRAPAGKYGLDLKGALFLGGAPHFPNWLPYKAGFKGEVQHDFLQGLQSVQAVWDLGLLKIMIKMTVRGTMVRSEVCNSWCFCLES